ncbi:hypothetical protein UVI_02060010 [Ustilaginoidea virens]|uniref:Uncharacterized protein n=1 Tax=Ustilaginoidea virens TaxID=1159556 RepID=A0A1B5L3Q8_USTVR|nr:hypothetical protein UVI_02060010 [Ustilaginoidea virens]
MAKAGWHEGTRHDRILVDMAEDCQKVSCMHVAGIERVGQVDGQSGAGTRKAHPLGGTWQAVWLK